MIRHFFLDKTNTIYKNNPFNNVGLNPIMELNYGNGCISRGLLHFDETEILKLVDDKTFADTSKLTFKLKMINCASVDGYPYDKLLANGIKPKERATSFDIIVMKLPCEFDNGKGFDYLSDFWVRNNRSFSYEPSNWNFSRNGYVWPVDKDKIDIDSQDINLIDRNIWILSGDTKVKINLEGGVYSNKFIEEEIVKYNSGETSLICNIQHFDYGCENLCLDITNYVLDIINGEPNYGLLLMFSPRIERMETEITQYVGFFTDYTNTFFHPYVECIYSEIIDDDRATFSKGKQNKLYLYANVNGIPQNLDDLPKCFIDEMEYPVKQAQKGVYCALIPSLSNEVEGGTILYDTWRNLALNGEKIEDVEMEFEVQDMRKFVSIGSTVSTKETFVPSLYGVNDAEELNRGEIREVTVDFLKEYDASKIHLIDSAEYRLYIKDGNREFTVIEYQPIEKGFLKNFFVIYTEDLIPGQYFVDIKVTSGRETKYYKDILRFKIISDVTERYE